MDQAAKQLNMLSQQPPIVPLPRIHHLGKYKPTSRRQVSIISVVKADYLCQYIECKRKHVLFLRTTILLKLLMLMIKVKKIFFGTIMYNNHCTPLAYRQHYVRRWCFFPEPKMKSFQHGIASLLHATMLTWIFGKTTQVTELTC